MTENMIIHECDISACQHLRPDYNYMDAEGIVHKDTKDICVRNATPTRCSDACNYNCSYKQHQRDLAKIRKYAECIDNLTAILSPYLSNSMGINDYGEFDIVLALKDVLETHVEVPSTSISEIF